MSLALEPENSAGSTKSRTLGGNQGFYGEEELGGRRYFAAAYPDRAVAEACVSCHNNHKDSPRTDA